MSRSGQVLCASIQSDIERTNKDTSSRVLEIIYDDNGILKCITLLIFPVPDDFLNPYRYYWEKTEFCSMYAN